MSRTLNYLLKVLVIIIIFLFSLEIVSFIFLKFDSTELFQVRNFTVKTNDQRFFTLKKNLSLNILDQVTKKRWTLFSSNERLRISKFDEKVTNYLNKDNNEIKFLFIGDSVPFGYGVDAKDSLPYIFQKYNKNLSIINGSIPSYSLDQSAERLSIEFNNLNNLKFIYLQIYDPVSQYAFLGTKWNENDNWSNFPSQVLRTLNLKKISLPLYGEPFFYNFFKKKLFRIKQKKVKENQYDINSDQKYENHINLVLNKIYNLIDEKKIHLIISSTNIPKYSISAKSKSHLRALKILNSNLESFASKNKYVHFFDISKKLNLDDKKMFIDNCCHLSNLGSELTAVELTKLVKSLD